LRTIAVYALLLWAYLAANSFTHPGTLSRRLTHFSPVPAEGTAAVCSFAASAVALLLLRVRGESRVRARAWVSRDG
jgi:hypothetical protein